MPGSPPACAMNKRLLIVDESTPFLRSLTELLEGYCVEWTVCAQASDGLEAIEKAMQSGPDLVILSSTLPRLNGMSAVLAIRERLPDVPVLMLSVRGSAELAAANRSRRATSGFEGRPFRNCESSPGPARR